MQSSYVLRFGFVLAVCFITILSPFGVSHKPKKGDPHKAEPRKVDPQKVIKKLRHFCILPYFDCSFMDRAYLMQNSIPRKEGGMFRVNQEMINNAIGRCFYDNVDDCIYSQALIGMKIVNVTMEDANANEYISGVVFFFHVASLIPTSDTAYRACNIEKQAEYWKKYIYTGEHEVSFVEMAKKLRGTYGSLKQKIDIILISDPFSGLKTMSVQFVKARYPGVRHAVIFSSTQAKLVFGLNETNLQNQLRLIQKAQMKRGVYNLHLALDIAQRILILHSSFSTKRFVVIRFTRGLTDPNRKKASVKIDTLKRQGVTVFMEVLEDTSIFRRMATQPICTNSYHYWPNTDHSYLVDMAFYNTLNLSSEYFNLHEWRPKRIFSNITNSSTRRTPLISITSNSTNDTIRWESRSGTPGLQPGFVALLLCLILAAG